MCLIHNTTAFCTAWSLLCGVLAYLLLQSYLLIGRIILIQIHNFFIVVLVLETR